MKLRLLAAVAATLLMTSAAHAMDCCKEGAKCPCCAPKEGEAPSAHGEKPHH